MSIIKPYTHFLILFMLTLLTVGNVHSQHINTSFSPLYIGVTTHEATNITHNSATISGSVTNENQTPIYYKGFEWREADCPDLFEIGGYDNGNNFEALFYPLASDKSYIIQAFISINGTKIYGEKTILKTLPSPLQAEIITLDPTNITHIEGTLNGICYGHSLLSAGIGFKWDYYNIPPTNKSTTSHFPNQDSLSMNSPMIDTVEFSITIKCLMADRGYSYRAFIKSDDIYVFGAIKTFFTPPEPIPSSIFTEFPSNISATSATLNASYTLAPEETISTKGFEYRAEHETQYHEVQTDKEDNHTFETTLSDLEKNVTYSYRAFIGVGDTRKYGVELSFTTTELAIETDGEMKKIISAYPNPIQDIVEISMDKTVTEVRLYSLDGSLLSCIKNNGVEKTHMSLRSFKSAIYILTAESPEGTFSIKIIKE